MTQAPRICSLVVQSLPILAHALQMSVLVRLIALELVRIAKQDAVSVWVGMSTMNARVSLYAWCDAQTPSKMPKVGLRLRTLSYKRSKKNVYS